MAIGRVALPISSGSSAPTEGTFYMGYSGATNSQVGTMVSYFSTLLFINAKKWSKISLSNTHMIGIYQGELWVEGYNTNGRIGLGNTSTYKELQRIGSDSDWTDCAAGINSSYAIRSGMLFVTGNNGSGELGLGDTTSRTSFTQVGSDTNWSKVSSSFISAWACAVKNGTLMTCGNNTSYQTGLNVNTGTTTTWTLASNAETFTDVSAGVSHGMAIGGGKIYSWGLNTNGRTARGTSSSSTQTPTQSGSDTNWSKVSCGNEHSVAIKTTGGLYSVGNGGSGRLGLNNTTSYNTWQQVGSDTDWESISLNTTNTTGLTDNSYAIKGGKLYATGTNTYGQLGQPFSTSTSNIFVQIGTATNHTRLVAGAGFVLTVRGTP
jgi:alpha-tubulin suppressor-like RCC1 family protein